MSDQPGRYQRTFPGLLASLLVTVLVIGAFVAFRAAFRNEVDNRPQAVDWAATVAQAQDAGLTIVHPASLPEGWIATSIDFEPGTTPSWGMGMLTEDERFVGIRQEADDVEDLLATYVDDDPNEIQRLGEVTLQGRLADEWSAYTDSGGDRAYAAEVRDQVVLVYGSAPEEDLRALVGLLTTDPIR